MTQTTERLQQASADFDTLAAAMASVRSETLGVAGQAYSSAEAAMEWASLAQQYRNSAEAAAAGIAARTPVKVTELEALVAANPQAAGALGEITLGDGYRAVYDPADRRTMADYGYGALFGIDATGKRWSRVWDGKNAMASWWKVQPGDDPNLHERFHELIAGAPEGTTILLDKGTYTLRSHPSMENRNGITIRGIRGQTIIRMSDTAPTKAPIWGAVDGASVQWGNKPLLRFLNCEDITIEGITFDNGIQRRFGGVQVRNCRRFKALECAFIHDDITANGWDWMGLVAIAGTEPSEMPSYASGKDPTETKGSRDIHVERCIFMGCQLEIDDSRRVRIDGNIFFRTHVTAAICVGVVGNDQHPRDYQITRNLIIGPQGAGIWVHNDRNYDLGTWENFHICDNEIYLDDVVSHEYAPDPAHPGYFLDSMASVSPLTSYARGITLGYTGSIPITGNHYKNIHIKRNLIVVRYDAAVEGASIPATASRGAGALRYTITGTAMAQGGTVQTSMLRLSSHENCAAFYDTFVDDNILIDRGSTEGAVRAEYILSGSFQRNTIIGARVGLSLKGLERTVVKDNVYIGERLLQSATNLAPFKGGSETVLVTSNLGTAIEVVNTAYLMVGGIVPTVSVAYDPPSIAGGGNVTHDIAVQGARNGDAFTATFSAALPAGVTLSARYNSDNRVRVTIANGSAAAADLGTGTLTVATTTRVTLAGGNRVSNNETIAIAASCTVLTLGNNHTGDRFTTPPVVGTAVVPAAMSITNDNHTSFDVPVPGALVGDFAQGTISTSPGSFDVSASVPVAGTVRVRVTNRSGGTLDISGATIRASSQRLA